MKVKKENTVLPKDITDIGTSSLFKYATQQPDQLKQNRLQTWSRLNRELAKSWHPQNGFEEAIVLTEQGRLWKYPIDNECGMDEEKKVPFEEHVFLDKHLEGFSENEYIQTFMGFVTAGLARNPWMTVDRKRRAIEWYRQYFESKREIYKEAGFDL
jgi:small subunit ribosomal protein S31